MLFVSLFSFNSFYFDGNFSISLETCKCLFILGLGLLFLGFTISVVKELSETFNQQTQVPQIKYIVFYYLSDYFFSSLSSFYLF